MRVTKNYSYYFIYMTKNLINNKCYIGWHATNNLNDQYIGSGKLLNRSIKKYGKNNFVTGIIEFYSKDNILEKEKYWIKERNTIKPNGYNLTGGGDGGNTYLLLTEKEKKKFRENCSKNNKGKTRSEETRTKISESHKGHSWTKGILKSNSHKESLKTAWKKRRIEKPMSNETKEKLSNAMKGRVFSEETLEKIRKIWVGRHHSEESKEKNRQKHLGKKYSDETNKKKGSPGDKNPMFGTTFIWINNGIINKRCPKNELTLFLEKDWKLGRYKL